MKYLLVLVVVGIGVWLLLRARADKPGGPGGGSAHRQRRPGGSPEEIVACAHCGLHLPRGDAVLDPAGRPFCSDAHRIAGPK